jgi:hypothetical protein
MRRSLFRRGLSSIQWIVVASVTFLVIIGSVHLIGQRTDNKLDETASDLTDPSLLTKRFSSSKGKGS